MAATSSSGRSNVFNNDDGLAVVRIKPMGAGAGGIEMSSAGLADGEGALRYTTEPASVTVVPSKTFSYPKTVVTPEVDNATLYDQVMPQRVEAFLAGVNVNLMAYGQTGTGKTHTIFGAPGVMDKAGRGEFGTSCPPEYGLCPRAILHIFSRVQKLGKNYQLTASAIELSSLLGNIDLMVKVPENRDPKVGSQGGAERFGIVLDKNAKPPRMYGMQQVVLDSPEAIFNIFKALSLRCTAGTGLNNTSSRTHCFVWITLRRYDPQAKTVSTSRFQFVDLAGSERMKDAHGTLDWKAAGDGGVVGLCTNMSLMMLSQAVRVIVRQKKKVDKFNLPNAFLFDLIPLLKESMSGTAMTAVFVCLSQAPDNSSQSINALDFGEQFSQLPVRPKKVKPAKVNMLLKDAKQLYLGAKGALANKKLADRYRVIREAQAKDGGKLLELLSALSGSEKSS